MAKVIDIDTYKKTKNDLDRYSPILTIQQAAKEKNNTAVIESTEYFLRNLGISEEDAKLLMPTALEGLEKLVNGFIPKFGKVLGSAKLSDLRNYYSDSFEKFYTKENLSKVDEIFDSSDTYESIAKKHAKAKEIVESNTGNFSDEQKEKAEKDLKKLERIVVPLDEFMKLKVEKAMEPYRTKSLKEEMNSAYEEKKAA